MITRIAIDGYKCFSKFDFSLEDPAFVFFSGRNGSGKSTLFETLALVRDIAARGVPLVADDGRFIVMGSTVTRWKDKVDAPGIVRTERFAELYESDGAKIDDRISRIPIGRLAAPDDIADACLYLASDLSSYVTGQILGVDGACVM